MLNQRLPSWLLLLLVSSLVFSWTYLLAKSISYRDPGSRFFDPHRAYSQKYSAHRSSEAAKYEEAVKSWLSNADNFHKGGTIDKWSLGVRRKGSDPIICAVFITTARPIGTQYIDGAISSALHGLTPTERKLLDLRVYFSNLTPSDHPSYGSWIHNITDAQLTPHDIADGDLLFRLHSLAELHNHHAKSGLDYSLAMQNCLDNSTAPYIAIFEGDIQLASSWFIRLLSAIKTAEALFLNLRWLLVRLFNEERATGFSSKHPLGNNAPLIILLTDAVLIFILYNLRRLFIKLGKGRKVGWVTPNFCLVLCGFVIPAFTILFFQTGKATVLPPSPGLRAENFGCCTQAMIYPRAEVSSLIDELRRRAEEEDYDVIINDYSWQRGGSASAGERMEHFSLYPIMVQHVGFESVISPDRDSDKQIWSMAYEDLQPEKLRKEHESMVKGMFGEGFWLDNRP